jgi:hypothetical protein
MKHLLIVVGLLGFIGSAQAENTTPVATENGFNLFQDIDAMVMNLDMDEFDPAAEGATEMLNAMEAMGEFDIIEDNYVQKVGGCSQKVKAVVSRSEQRLRVYLNCSSTPTYTWATSTGIKGRSTPTFNTQPSGRFGKIGNSSSKYPGGGCKPYGNMPFAVYFKANGNYAIHGTCAEGKLGKPASHGCIRISRANAKTFQDIVKAAASSNGLSSIKIIVQ